MKECLLTVNAGSSSLKFCVYQHQGDGLWRVEARGQLSGIGTSTRFVAKGPSGKLVVARELGDAVLDGHGAIDAVATWLRSEYGEWRVVGVGHRVVHGGDRYAAPVILNREILGWLKQIGSLAPLHQPYNLAPIERLFDRLPNTPQVACFDTAFSRGHSAVAKILPLPEELRRCGLERYGFHGLSYEYVASMLPDVAPEIARGRVVIAHLGNGASLCALRNGKSVENTFSFTPLDGLCMGTRPGSLDPGAVLYMFQNLELSPKEVETILYKKAGLRGISGMTGDMKELLSSSEPDAVMAVQYFVYQASKQLGAMAAVLGGIDGLVFTAGIGENSPEIRKRIASAASWLGIEIDAEANLRMGPHISTTNSRVSVWVIPTNEEFMLAKHTASLLKLGAVDKEGDDGNSSSIRSAA
jgi:acetate kinase